MLKIKRIFAGNSNMWIIVSGGEAALIDAGLGDRSDKVLRILQKAGIQPEGLRYIFITHAHYDHVGGIKSLKEKMNAKVIVHELESENVRQGKSPVPFGTMWFSKPVSWLGTRLFNCCIRFQGVEPDIVVHDSLELKLGDVALNVIHTPGHTAGSISIIADKKHCFVGDTLFNILPNSHYPPFANDEFELLKTWQILAKCGASMFYPGHGSKIDFSDSEVKFLK